MTDKPKPYCTANFQVECRDKETFRQLLQAMRDFNTQHGEKVTIGMTGTFDSGTAAELVELLGTIRPPFTDLSFVPGGEREKR